MTYLLDTNVLIAAMKGAESMRRRLAQVPAEALVLSPVVLGELWLGVAKSAFAPPWNDAEHPSARMITGSRPRHERSAPCW